MLVEQLKDTNPPQRKRKKTVAIEKMADLYLASMAREEGNPVFLNEVLNKKGIFYTYDSINECLTMLTKLGFIKPAEFGVSTFKISQDKDVMRRRMAKTWSVPLYHITDAGLHFTTGGQEFDVEGRKSRDAKKEKNKEKLTAAAITVGITLLTMFIKWFFFDRK